LASREAGALLAWTKEQSAIALLVPNARNAHLGNGVGITQLGVQLQQASRDPQAP
jgi:hypothetical protein